MHKRGTSKKENLESAFDADGDDLKFWDSDDDDGSTPMIGAGSKSKKRKRDREPQRHGVPSFDPRAHGALPTFKVTHQDKQGRWHLELMEPKGSAS